MFKKNWIRTYCIIVLNNGLIRLHHESMNLVFTDFCTIISQLKKETNFLLVPKDFFSQLKRLKQMLPNIALEEKIGENKIHRFLV